MRTRFIQQSIANAGQIVPFTSIPTIGGPDINGQSREPSYPDYRFRTPNILLIHGAYEQSLGKLPIGLSLGIDEAKAVFTATRSSSLLVPIVLFKHLQQVLPKHW